MGLMLIRALLVCGLVGTLLHGPRVLAQDLIQERTISLGYVGTTGNTETETYNLEGNYSIAWSNWEHDILFQALGSRKNEKASAERYYLEDKSNYRIGARHYLYLRGNYTQDRFSGFDYQASVTGGYGRYLYDLEPFQLEGFAGVGYRQNNFTAGGSEGEVIILSVGETLEWDITRTASLTQSFSTEIGREMTVSRLEIGLVTNIIDRISTKIAFQLRNSSNVPDGTEDTDTQTSINLVYEF